MPPSARAKRPWIRRGEAPYLFGRGVFEIISKSARNIADLDKAPEKVLLCDTQTVAAPTLLYVKGARNSGGKPAGTYYLATELYPRRYTADSEGECQVKLFAGDSLDGDFQSVEGNPMMTGQRACLFQHVFNGRFCGFDCHLVDSGHWVLEEVEAPLP